MDLCHVSIFSQNLFQQQEKITGRLINMFLIRSANVGTARLTWQHGSINYIQVASEKRGVHNGSI